MADEESEVRRMAEIADAINSILDTNPSSVGDTPAEAPANDAPANDTTAQSDVVDGADLDAAIAAEFGDAGPVPQRVDAAADGAADGAGRMTGDDYFGPPPALGLPGGDGPNNALGQAVKADSELAGLSVRLHDTLAEIRHHSNAAWQGADDLLDEMEAARAALVADMRGQIQNIAQATRQRREAIMQQLEQLEQESLTARDEMEIMLVRFENSFADLHRRYFQSAETERERLNRYREFLQFLLDERGR